MERRANELIDARLREIEQERAKADELMSKLLEDKEVRRLLVRKIRELGLAEKVR